MSAIIDALVGVITNQIDSLVATPLSTRIITAEDARRVKIDALMTILRHVTQAVEKLRNA